MHITSTEIQNQTINSDKLRIFSDYFSSLKVGSMLNRSGIVKTKGASPLELFTIVFNLAFIGKNFFEGVVRNKKVDAGKDAVYNFLNSSNTELVAPPFWLHHFLYTRLSLFQYKL